MTYQKPDLFLVGSAQGLVLGLQAGPAVYSDRIDEPGGNHQFDGAVSRDDAGE